MTLTEFLQVTAWRRRIVAVAQHAGYGVFELGCGRYAIRLRCVIGGDGASASPVTGPHELGQVQRPDLTGCRERGDEVEQSR